MCEIDRPVRLGSTDKLARGNRPVADSAVYHCWGSQVCDWATGWTTKDPDFDSQQRKKFKFINRVYVICRTHPATYSMGRMRKETKA